MCENSTRLSLLLQRAKLRYEDGDKSSYFSLLLKMVEYNKELKQNKYLAEANYLLALCYQFGIGTNIDNSKVFYYCNKATKMKYIKGRIMMAKCYIDGIGIEKNEAKAIYNLYHSATYDKQINATYELGKYYLNKQDYIKAEKWFKESLKLNQNHGESMHYLGFIAYEYAELNIDDDKEKFKLYLEVALDWFEKSIKIGNEASFNSLIEICERYELYNYLIEVCKYGYIKFNNSDCALQIAYCYKNGIGLPKMDEEYRKWLAIYRNLRLENNDSLLKKIELNDKRYAFQLYQSIATDKIKYGMNNVGRCYYFGIGCDQSDVKAFYWYLKAENYKEIESIIYSNKDIINSMELCILFKDYIKIIERKKLLSSKIITKIKANIMTAELCKIIPYDYITQVTFKRVSSTIPDFSINVKGLLPAISRDELEL